MASPAWGGCRKASTYFFLAVVVVIEVVEAAAGLAAGAAGAAGLAGVAGVALAGVALAGAAAAGLAAAVVVAPHISALANLPEASRHLPSAPLVYLPLAEAAVVVLHI